MNRKTCERCGQKPAVKYRKLCHGCRSRQDRERYPFRYFWWKLKASAKRREIPFNLSFEEFKHLWIESGKWEQKLKQTENSDMIWSVDREDVNEGYSYDNCKIIEKNLNVLLWYTRDQWNINFKWRERWASRNGKPVEECPF